MADDKNELEILEDKISHFQKQILIKRAMLKNEIEKDNESMIEMLQNEISTLKEKILFSQGELRKKYLKIGNRELEVVKKQSLEMGM